MVVIVIIVDPRGPRFRHRPPPVNYISYVFINRPVLFTQVEPGDTFATTKEGKSFYVLKYFRKILLVTV